jgi:hypothetical protein
VDLLIIIILVVFFVAQLPLLFGLPLHPLALLALLLPPSPIGPLPLLIILPPLHLPGVGLVPHRSGRVFREWRVKIMNDIKVPL